MVKGRNSTSKGVRLRDEVWEWLAELADKRGKTMNEMISMIIEATMAKEKRSEG